MESVQNEMGKMQAQLAQDRVHGPRQAPGAVPMISVQLPQIEASYGLGSEMADQCILSFIFHSSSVRQFLDP